MLVRKFNFPLFIEIIRTTVIEITREKGNEWVNLSELVARLKYQVQKYPILTHLSEHEIEQKILVIDPKYINFNDDKNLIRITT